METRPFPQADRQRGDSGNLGAAFPSTPTNLTIKPYPPVRGSLECFLCESVKGPYFHWQQNYV